MVEHIALPTPTSAALAALGSVDSFSVNMSLCGLYLHLSFPPGKFFRDSIVWHVSLPLLSVAE